MKRNTPHAVLAALSLLVLGILLALWPTTEEQVTESQPNTVNQKHLSPGGPGSLQDVARELETAKGSDRAKIISEGVRIARARQAELARAAKSQPERVLNAMMSLDELAALPPEIRAESEKPFSAVGSIDLRWATSINSDGSLHCSHTNLAIADGETFEVAGASFIQPRQPMTNIPLNGYIVGGILVLEKSGVRQLSHAETEVAGSFFPDVEGNTIDPVSGRDVTPAVKAVIAGKIFNFESSASIEQVGKTLEDAANAINPLKNREVSHGLAWLPVAADSGSGIGVPVLDTPFQDDAIDVLFIRANFPDLTDIPVTKDQLENSLNAVNSKIRDFSYGKGSIIHTVTDVVYELTTGAETVATGGGAFGDNETIIAEARAAAEADGFTLSDYDVVAVFFPDLSEIADSKITYGGLATIGGANHWINGVPTESQVSILLHEFGHNYGLNHSNYFNPARDFPPGDAGPNGIAYLDPNQVSLEYGDIFDRMGEGDATSGWFNPYATSRLEWLPPSKVIEPDAAGTFRVHRFDHASATNNSTLALRVPMGGKSFHWVGLRELFPATAGKAYIVNEGIHTDTPNLIDTTPNSMAAGAADRSDAALPVGGVFYDSAAGVRFTTMSSGGEEPNQFIDVKIEFDTRLELESTNVIINEAAGNAALVVRRGFNSLGACSVSYSTTGGTATQGTDYYSTTGTLTWTDGDTSSRTIYIPIRPDASPENTETFTLALSSPNNAVVAPSRNIATVTILDAGSEVTEFDPPFFNTQVTEILPLDDGKILAAGTMVEGVTGNIARFNADGSDDATFLKGTGFTGNGTSTRSLALAKQDDGKFLVGGEFRSYNGTDCSMITRLNPDGTPDTDFCTAIGSGANNRVHTIAIQSDGKILLGGDFTEFDGTVANGIVRLTTSGARDLESPFDPDFGFTANVPAFIQDILVQEDDKVMIGGQFILDPDGLGRFRFGIARLNSDGSRDDTFDPGYGTHGYDANLEIPSLNNSVRYVRSIARQRDGKYIIGGNFTGYNDLPANFLIRINADGSRDDSFAPPAITTVQNFFPIEDIFIQPTGRILVAGRFNSPVGGAIGLLPNGGLDPAFNLSGGASGPILAVTADTTGKVFLGGNFFHFAGSTSRPIVKVSGGIDSYTIWTNTVFTPAQIAAGNTLPQEDFDNDGILNITEMALGISPTQPNSPESFAIATGNLSIQTSGDIESLQASMQRSADNIGVWLVAQFSSDLTNWFPENPIPGSNATYDVVESTSTRFTVKDKTPAGPGVRRFVRFRAVVPN